MAAKTAAEKKAAAEAKAAAEKKAAAEAKSYKVTTKLDTFAGVVCGVQFNKGMAIVRADTVPDWMGRSYHQVARMMEKDFGYEVEPEF